MRSPKLHVILLTTFLFPFSAFAAPTVVSKPDKSYDFIVVGGGTSGLVIANRLSEDPKVSVLVLEAGPLVTNDNDILVPGFFFRPSLRWDWGILSTPQVELNNRTFQASAGKLAGGSSAVNGMFFDRGSKRDYDDWAKLTGDKSWGWDGLLKYFIKAETFTPPPKEIAQEYGIEYDPKAHGTNGPIQSTYPPFIWSYVKMIRAGLKALGAPTPKDGGNGNALGVFWIPQSLVPKSWTRSYAEPAYNRPALQRPNYHLSTNQTVTKILFNSKKAIGVRYQSSPGGPVSEVQAKNEIILAAGALNSPKLLQLSGVGDKNLLSRLSIPLVQDLPGVGNNFQDHSGANILYNLTRNPDPLQLFFNTTAQAEAERQYFENKTGPYTSSVGNQAAFLPYPLIAPDTYKQSISRSRQKSPSAYLRPNLPAAVVSGYKRQKEILLDSISTNEVAVDEAVDSLASIQHPLSRGYVEIASNDPWTAPVVNYRTISDPFDLEVLLAGLRFARKLFKRRELASMNPVELDPGEQVTSDEALTNWARGVTTSSFAHHSGTTSMGKLEYGAVVDTKLRVHGVKGLRVVDAGIIPLIPATHISNTVYAVAEKAADIIKQGN